MGAPEKRMTMVISGNSVTQTDEACSIITGNTGTFTTRPSSSGTFVIGGKFSVSGGSIAIDPSTGSVSQGDLELIEIDVTKNGVTRYTVFKIQGNDLSVGYTQGSHDGSTPQKRANGCCKSLEVFRKQ